MPEKVKEKCQAQVFKSAGYVIGENGKGKLVRTAHQCFRPASMGLFCKQHARFN